MLAENRSLKVLLGVLVVLIVISAVVVSQGYQKPRVVYVDRGTEFDPNLLMLGVRMSKFEGMEIHRDSPAVLLSRAEKLDLTTDQQDRLHALIDQSRQAALAVLTAEQLDRISPIPAEPFVVDELDRTIPVCEGDACDYHDHDHAH
jgi:hypothetical protein